MWGCDSLSILAVFSVVISISGSVKYSDATHLPFSGPERERERKGKRMKRDTREIFGLSQGHNTSNIYLHVKRKEE